VTLAEGREIEYERLVLATGASPRRLGVAGEHLDGVHAFRTLADARAVRAAAETTASAVVVGAGFIGMETAASLRRRGLEVTLVEPGDSLFAALRAPCGSASRRPAHGRPAANRSNDYFRLIDANRSLASRRGVKFRRVLKP
jgi:NADPH-dependent 2,4-dienoyl-CoA reductase/sulfur reductase-like enzyme